ncbi:hypothetical protein Golob_012936, partial [Gossypium lobatum]|nr:hypothetical protein [Gossypium lobatum]
MENSGRNMENDIANLTLEDDKDDILMISNNRDAPIEVYDLCLVGRFLTTSVIHFPIMRSTMANLWHNNEEHNGKFMAHSEKSTDFRSGEKRFLFKFLHKIDLERVQNGSPWTFNNHLLVLHRMVAREKPLQVPLLLVCFWVQVHELPPSFFSEQLARQLGDFLGAFMEYDTKSLER